MHAFAGLCEEVKLDMRDKIDSVCESHDTMLCSVTVLPQTVETKHGAGQACMHYLPGLL